MEHIFNWTKRVFVVVPFGVAFALTVLMNLPSRLPVNRQHIASYGLTFASPWARLLDHGWFRSLGQHRSIDYAVVFWIPALFYALAVWLIFECARWMAGRFRIWSL